MKLYFHPVSTASRPVLLFCAENNVSYEPIVVDLMTGEHMQEAYAKLNPSSIVPCLDDDGFILSESSAILKYLAEKTGSKTYPKDDLKMRARINERMDWFNTQLSREIHYHLAYPQLFPHHKRATDDAQKGTLEWGKTQAERWLGVLDKNIIGNNKFVCGDQITIADYFGAEHLATTDLLGASFKRFPNVDRWMSAMRALPSWAKVNEATDGFAASLKGKEFVTIS